MSNEEKTFLRRLLLAERLFKRGRRDECLDLIGRLRVESPGELLRRYPLVRSLENTVRVESLREELAAATLAIEERLPDFVMSDGMAGRAQRFYERWYEPLKAAAAGVRITGDLPGPGTPVLLVPHFFSGIGDWVLINQLMRRKKRDYPPMPLVVAVPLAQGYASFYRDIAALNPDVAALVEVPLGLERYASGEELVAMDNVHGMNPLVWGEALLQLTLRRVNVGRMYKYANFPRLVNYGNSVAGKRRCEYVHELHALLATEGDVPGLMPAEADEAAADEMIRRWGIAGDKILVILHVKFQDDLDAFLRVLGTLAAGLPLAVVRVGTERHNFTPRPWLIDGGDVPMRVLAGLMKRARLFAGSISGPMHLAAAVKTPVAALYFREYTGIDWHPELPPERYVMLYKKAYGADGSEIVDPTAYGYKNEHVARFEAVPDDELERGIRRLLDAF